MTTIAEVRDAMATAITESGCGITGVPYESSTNPLPCAVVKPGSYDPRYVLGKATAVYPFKITVLVGHVAERSALKLCDELREPRGGKSLTAVLESDTLWTGLAQEASVTLVGEAGEITIATETLLAFTIDMEVTW